MDTPIRGFAKVVDEVVVCTGLVMI